MAVTTTLAVAQWKDNVAQVNWSTTYSNTSPKMIGYNSYQGIQVLGLRISFDKNVSSFTIQNYNESGGSEMFGDTYGTMCYKVLTTDDSSYHNALGDTHAYDGNVIFNGDSRGKTTLTLEGDFKNNTNYYIFFFGRTKSGNNNYRWITINVTGNYAISIPTVVEKVGVVNIYVNGEWKQATPYVYNGGWQQATPYIYNGGWQICT